MSIEELEKAFGYREGVSFQELAGGVVIVTIDAPLAIVNISLYGGQVLSWQPKTQAKPVLWTSDLVKFQKGKAIRAGVPICWPWFGAHTTNHNLPGHGYARITNWILKSIVNDANGTVKVYLALGESDLATVHWSSRVSLELKITIGVVLEVELITSNDGTGEIEFTEGLHTYFQVSDIANVQVLGLDGANYIDLVNENESRTQYGPIVFDGELGRIFLKNTATCSIEDKGLNRIINIRKFGSNSTAVWNPGLQVASTMVDLGSAGWRSMICVESANALTDKITLTRNKKHTHHVIYSVKSLS
jgi:D-hexose-6-phosphate mutarotase